MSVAACLLLYSVVVLVVGPPALCRLTQTGYASRLGVAAWMTAIGSVLLSWVAASMFALAELVQILAHGSHPSVSHGCGRVAARQVRILSSASPRRPGGPAPGHTADGSSATGQTAARGHHEQ